jgi:hypothetical protein
MGHGRAWLHAAQQGHDGSDDSILHALLHSLAYDTQCEGDRSSWMMGIVDAAKVGDRLYPRFIEQVHEPPRDDCRHHHMWQRSAVLGTLAKRGDGAALAALKRLFMDNQKEHPNDELGAEEIIEVAGEEGLVLVCSELGRGAHANPDTWFDDRALEVFDESREPGNAIRTLEMVRETDQGVDHFLSIREANHAERAAAKANRKSRSPAELALPFGAHYESVPRAFHSLRSDQIIDWVRNAPFRPGSIDGRGWLTGWAAKAGDAALREILDALESTDEPLHQRRYLSIFSRRPMPRVSERVLHLAELEDAEMRRRAYEALRNVADPRIREIGLRSLSPEQVLAGSLKLFESTYEPGDHLDIEAALVLPDDRDDLHSVVFGLVDLCAEVRQPECLALMLFVYEYSPCGNCRAKAVDTLTDLGIAPDWLSEECQFDAMQQVRCRFGGPTLED